MAFEVTIEADTRLDKARFVELMKAYGAELEDLETEISAFFPVSQTVLFFEDIPPQAVQAEGVPGLNWEIGSILTFRYAHRSSGGSREELHKVLEFLSADTPAFFVVSVDFSIVIAIRDEAGLRFLPSWT